jgi:hypothetical protein
MRRIVVFSVICVVAIIAVFLAIGAFGGLSGLGLDTHGVIALALGILITSGLGIGLMALVFYSNRSGQDESVQRRQQ